MCANKTQLRSAIAMYRRLKAEEAEISRQLKEVSQEIFDYFDRHNIEPKEQVVGQNFIASYSLCKSSKYDTDKLAAAVGGNLDAYKIFGEYRRLCIK